jgi:hypothetical protein
VDTPRLTSQDISVLIQSLDYSLDRIRMSTSFSNHEQRRQSLSRLEAVQQKLRSIRIARKGHEHGRSRSVH